MDKKIVGVVSAITGLVALDPTAQAANATPGPDAVTGAQSFADLLAPIPNALAALRAADAAAARAAQDESADSLNGDTKVAQYHHHHHHHHSYRHHHHHHHHHRAFIRVIPRGFHGHHHHHHHHHHHNY